MLEFFGYYIYAFILSACIIDILVIMHFDNYYPDKNTFKKDFLRLLVIPSLISFIAFLVDIFGKCGIVSQIIRSGFIVNVIDYIIFYILFLHALFLIECIVLLITRKTKFKTNKLQFFYCAILHLICFVLCAALVQYSVFLDNSVMYNHSSNKHDKQYILSTSKYTTKDSIVYVDDDDQDYHAFSDCEFIWDDTTPRRLGELDIEYTACPECVRLYGKDKKVLASKHGDKYHSSTYSSTCPYISERKTYKINLPEALARNYSPCEICNP